MGARSGTIGRAYRWLSQAVDQSLQRQQQVLAEINEWAEEDVVCSVCNSIDVINPCNALEVCEGLAVRRRRKWLLRHSRAFVGIRLNRTVLRI
jgi:hypothetical protein